VLEVSKSVESPALREAVCELALLAGPQLSAHPYESRSTWFSDTCRP